MLYEYKCPKCGWEGQRLSRIADADNQYCNQPVPESEDENANIIECGAKLEREEISVTSKMANQWSRWSGNTD